jgi:hypothetical protein
MPEDIQPLETRLNNVIAESSQRLDARLSEIFARHDAGLAEDLKLHHAAFDEKMAAFETAAKKAAADTRACSLTLFPPEAEAERQKISESVRAYYAEKKKENPAP